MDAGNRTGNPLRPYRMAMLQHGFVDEEAQPTFKPDEVDPMAYGIVKLRGRAIPRGVLIAVAVLVVIVVVAIAVLG